MSGTARALIGISLFNAVSAFGGGIGLVTGTLPVPTSLLRRTPFDSYSVPGLFLAVVMGGSALLGALALLNHVRQARFISATTGLMMVGWILGETVIVQGFSWLQGLYLLTGLLVAVGSWRLRVAAPRAPGSHRRPPSRGQPTRLRHGGIPAG